MRHRGQSCPAGEGIFGLGPDVRTRAAVPGSPPRPPYTCTAFRQEGSIIPHARDCLASTLRLPAVLSTLHISGAINSVLGSDGGRAQGVGNPANWPGFQLTANTRSRGAEPLSQDPPGSPYIWGQSKERAVTGGFPSRGWGPRTGVSPGHAQGSERLGKLGSRRSVCVRLQMATLCF